MYYRWLTIDAANAYIAELSANEGTKEYYKHGKDRRNSSPVITGDGFRDMSLPHLCDETNRCRFDPDKMTPGACVFIAADFFGFFGADVVQRIKVPYILISHNGDQSSPDGQTDARVGLQTWNTTLTLQAEYDAGRLLALHAQNLWWKNPKETPRPPYAHCLPIGLENRYNWFGSNLTTYIEAMKWYVHLVEHEKKAMFVDLETLPPRPLLLVAFHQKRQVPDRSRALHILKTLGAKDMFFNHTSLNHRQWLEAITWHRFTLAPHGHGLDTHRLTEILMMGGIPVIRRSSITSCYDDSDNQVAEAKPRGSLPIVVVDSYENLSRALLESEWLRITKLPPESWDWRRLHLDHWRERIACHRFRPSSRGTTGRSLE